MSYDNYLINLANISNEIGYSLTYGYGDIAATEINSLKALIAKSEEIIPILEAEACFNEAEKLDREERSFNNWMTMLYGNENVVSPVDTHNINKANRLKRRKANKKHHKADRYHGKSVEPYLYKENGIIKESIEMTWHKCCMPVSDKAHNHSALKAEAREQEYLFSKQETEEPVKEIKSEESKVEGVGLEDFLWYLIDKLPEEKFIVLHNFDNGEEWENHEYETNRFLGVMTKDKVIAELTERFLHHFDGVDVGDITIKGLKGIEFKWDFGYGEWGWDGYESYTILPVSEI